MTVGLAASTEYGTHNALPSYIGVLHPNQVHRHNIHLLSYKVFNHIRSQDIIRNESYVEIPMCCGNFLQHTICGGHPLKSTWTNFPILS